MLAHLASVMTLAVFHFNVTPNQNAPGVKGIQNATNEIAMYALLGCGIGAVASLLMLAIAEGLHLERLHARGKEGVIVALGAAFFVGSIAAFLMPHTRSEAGTRFGPVMWVVSAVRGAD